MADRETEASIAEAVEVWMCCKSSITDLAEPWEINSLDLGEVEITTPGGQKFRLSVEEVDEF